jgi:anti-sigma regulatory factor (Ser/Thr protein kinase)
MAPAVQIVSVLHNDPRLLIGAATIAGHAAHEAGFDEAAQEHLGTATKEACGEVFAFASPNSKPAPLVNLTASRFPDRIEILVELSMAPAKAKAGARSKKAAGRDGKRTGRGLDEGLVDQVQRETRDGRPAIVLTKYCRPVKFKA